VVQHDMGLLGFGLPPVTEHLSQDEEPSGSQDPGHLPEDGLGIPEMVDRVGDGNGVEGSVREAEPFPRGQDREDGVIPEGAGNCAYCVR